MFGQHQRQHRHSMIHQISDRQIMISEEENEDSFDEDEEDNTPALKHNEEIEEEDETPRREGSNLNEMDEGSGQSGEM